MNFNDHLIRKEKLKNAFLNEYVFENLRLRLGILLILIGLIWFCKIAGIFASDFFGPLVMLAIGIWFIFTYFTNRIINKYNNWISCLDLKQGDYYGL